ncbi:MAG: hypothetical protein MMC33_008844 [Icmadophila ericetorum]|nr:hypothetical protein [Icmadophila ericetorum]
MSGIEDVRRSYVHSELPAIESPSSFVTNPFDTQTDERAVPFSDSDGNLEPSRSRRKTYGWDYCPLVRSGLIPTALSEQESSVVSNSGTSILFKSVNVPRASTVKAALLHLYRNPAPASPPRYLLISLSPSGSHSFSPMPDQSPYLRELLPAPSEASLIAKAKAAYLVIEAYKEERLRWQGRAEEEYPQRIKLEILARVRKAREDIIMWNTDVEEIWKNSPYRKHLVRDRRHGASYLGPQFFTVRSDNWSSG